MVTSPHHFKKLVDPCLTINGNKFVLLNPARVHVEEMRALSEWKAAGITDTDTDAYETSSLRAAAGFRRIADEKAEKFFRQSFQALYPIPPGRRFPSFLDPHQIDGVNWILSRKRSYLAHAPGAGKTPQATVAALIAQAEGLQTTAPDTPVLVLCPPALTTNWEREIRKFAQMTEDELWKNDPMWLNVGVVGRTEERHKVAWRGNFLVVPFSMLTKDWVYTALQKVQPEFIIVDEASALKEATSDRALAFFGGRYKGKDFPGLYQKARHVVLMDGSPMPNRPMELWAPTYALVPDAIDCLPQRDFGFRYCGGRMNERGEFEFKYSSNEEELNQKLTKSFMHVVTEDKLSHPERRRSMLFMNEDVRSPEFKAWERRNLSRVLKAIDAGENDPTQGEIAQRRRELGEEKVPWVARYVRDRLTRKNESILLFAWHREVCEKLQLELVEHDARLVYGGTHPTERERSFADFQAGKTRIIIGNISAMGRGHNLQKADRVIFAEYAWSDETNKQAEKRASRRGSTKEFVRCEYIVLPGSMDEKVLAALFAKERRVKRVIG